MVEQMRHFVGRNAARWKRLLLLEAAGLAVAAPLGYLWAIFFLDNSVHLPIWGRLLAALGLVGLLVLVGARLVRHLRLLALTEDEVALAIERQTRGGVQNRLINALQLSRGTAGEELTPAVVRENFNALQQTKLPAAVPSRPALVRAGLGALLIAVGLAFWALWPERFANAASRILLPLANIEPLYRTQLEVQPGDVEAEGDVTIRIHIRGERPDNLLITRMVQGERTRESIAVPEGADEVAYTFVAVRTSLTYTIQGGDYTTPVFRITVPAAVRLSLVRATFHYPEYTGRPPATEEHTGGDLEALRGTRAEVTFVFDHPVAEATLLVERGWARERATLATTSWGLATLAPFQHLLPTGPAATMLLALHCVELPVRGTGTVTEPVSLKQLQPAELQAAILFDDVFRYELEVKAADRRQRMGPFAIRVLPDQAPRLELAGLEQQAELSADAAIPLRVHATDDIGLEKVGLFVRRPGEGPGWKEIVVWQADRKPELIRTHELLLAALGVTEGDVFELVARAVDTDPLKKWSWTTGTPYPVQVGGDGVALQRQFEQVLRSEAELKALLAAETQAAEKTVSELKKLDPASGLRLDDPKALAAVDAAVAALATEQGQLREHAAQAARAMLAQAGNLRVSVGMLADTEMIQAIRILKSVASRDGPQAKRAALADARLTQERTARSLRDVLEHYVEFRHDWELTHMIAFVEMLADREARLRDQSHRHAATVPPEVLRGSMKNRQNKVLELVKLSQKAFAGLAERMRSVEPVLADGFQSAAVSLAAAPLHAILSRAADAAGAGKWVEAATAQDEAAKELAMVFARLKKAQSDAALKALKALQQKAKSDLEAQKELEKLKAGTTASFVDLKDKMHLEDILHMQEVAAKKDASEVKGPVFDYLLPESAKAMLSPPDTGKRQQFDILKLADSPTGTPSFPKQSDRIANPITKPPIQEKFDDLVGKLLEEADEIQKKYETYNLNAAFNINEPGDIGKQAGDINSTAASAATGNMKPPTVNVGGASRAGRRGARAHGLVVGEESINRRGRDKVQEGQEKASDQGGTIREKKSEDIQKDTSTGIGGKNVEGDDEKKFSVEDAGKWSDDIAKRLTKPQAKNFIVERKDGRLDPKVAEMLRDLTSRQEQLIERVKSLRKELRNLYLPDDHISELLGKLTANLDALKDFPDPELFRMQSEALDQLRNTVRVFQPPTSGFQPSLPRERSLHGRVLDEPARAPLPGYEEAVKRYYEKLSVR
jgi:hypothetical protein